MVGGGVGREGSRACIVRCPSDAGVKVGRGLEGGRCRRGCQGWKVVRQLWILGEDSSSTNGPSFQSEGAFIPTRGGYFYAHV
jgi:hypothetical protein